MSNQSEVFWRRYAIVLLNIRDLFGVSWFMDFQVFGMLTVVVAFRVMVDHFVSPYPFPRVFLVVQQNPSTFGCSAKPS